ncbi:SMP-30/gluconolactonase/LRE family protein [Leucobacter japonicus]|uniref:SMP-30/gluconolactonase/LRE family protein n=1 Tax=Leucobacter japonicus TaxID=1461259 RepID=UPI0006A7CF24|nr:SMP-30/gluconolactonase/LRE family protein [Leucobacter japonicus]
MTREVQVFRSTRAILVESLWWDARTSEVVWVDITAGLLHRGRLDGAVDGSEDRVVSLPPPVSAVQPAPGGRYVAALEDSVVLLGSDGLIERVVARLPHRRFGMRLNEGKVDPFGRFVVGGMGLIGEAPDADLWSVSADGDARALRGGFGVANGLEWSDDGRTMFVTDTSTSTIYRGIYGPNGDLGELAPHITGRAHDGLALAADGTFWNGLYGEGHVVRWAPDGTLLEEVPILSPNLTSVAFAGPELTTLLIGSARENLTEQQLQAAPESGAIYRIEVDPDEHGRPVHTFGTTRGHAS